jgi:hypothetical protein
MSNRNIKIVLVSYLLRIVERVPAICLDNHTSMQSSLQIVIVLAGVFFFTHLPVTSTRIEDRLVSVGG